MSAYHSRHISDGDSSAAVKKTRKKWIIILCVFLAVLVIGAGCVTGVLIYQAKEREKAYNQAVDEALADPTFYQGIVVEGVDLGGKTKEEAKELLADKEQALRPNVDIKATYQDQVFSLGQEDFAYTYHTDEVLEEAYQVGRSGEREERYQKIQDLKENPENFSLGEAELVIDDETINTFAQEISAAISVQGEDAQVVNFDPLAAQKFTYAEGKDGLSVDTDAIVSKVKEILNSEEKIGSFAIPVNTVSPQTTVEDLKKRTVKLSSYTTTSTNTANGNSNMKLALAAVNGTVLQPDEVFSFNNTTGDTTTPERGYKLAGALVDGSTEQQYGGGICQVSTTIYGAALRADMDITERYNHAKPSTYVPIGQDATVDYPGVDFKFRNSSSYPIYISAWMDGVVLHVEFYGYQPEEWDTIEVTSWQTGTIPQPEDVYTLDPSLAPGEKKLKRTGRSGIKAEGQRTYYKNGVQVKVDPLHRSTYRAIATEYLVGELPAN